MDNLKRILIVSYNCFDKSKSNGRTLVNLFDGWDSSHLAQFYMCNEIPNRGVCDD